ncbi:type IV pilus assembly protein PilW [Massilia sp. UYP11]|uniref:PilW family protein n=1 Tax=Massilia sp. UYP11 TaxID=1756385 RepID=UPI003D19C9C0
MKARKKTGGPRHRYRQAGLTIAELMVAMALGLAVLLASGSLLITSVRAHAAVTEATEMDDSGRYAVDALARAIRLAAHVDWAAHPGADPAAPARLAGLDASSLERSGPGIEATLPDEANGSDVLAVRFSGSGAPPGGDGATLDCAGFPVHRDEEGWSIFYVARNAQGDAELRCKYRGASNWSSDAVAGRVDGFQVLYGLDADGDRVPERYVNATELGALDAALAPVGATPDERAADLRRRTHWKRVALVRVALLLHGPRLDPGAHSDIVYDLFGPDHGAAFSTGDQGTRLMGAALDDGRAPRMRKVYGATIALPVAPD